MGYFWCITISLVVGFAVSFIFYSPEKRALSRLEQWVLAEERYVATTINRERSKFTAEFAGGATHLVERLKQRLPRFAHSKN